jgi:hypothetical protein
LQPGISRINMLDDHPAESASFGEITWLPLERRTNQPTQSAERPIRPADADRVIEDLLRDDRRVVQGFWEHARDEELEQLLRTSRRENHEPVDDLFAQW